jgi:putative modified peptide
MATRKTAAKSSGAGGGDGVPEPIARNLLKLLSTDDGFRRRFAKNHVAGLLEAAGVSPKAQKCARPKNKLASKKAIAEAHDEILESLTKCLDQQPVRMDTGK